MSINGIKLSSKSLRFKVNLWSTEIKGENVGLISTKGIGWRPSPCHPPLSTLIGGVTNRSVGSGPYRHTYKRLTNRGSLVDLIEKRV
jgi:hypothetical protein